MNDLFALPLVPGLAYGEAFLAPGEEATLVDALEAVELAPFKFQQWEGKRRTASFGWRYDFEDGGFRRAEPIPDFLQPVARRAAEFARLDPVEIAHALVVRYDPGAGIGWHRDRPVFEHVVGLSLGAPAVLRLRRRENTGRFVRASQPLAPRSIYHLGGEARHRWEHSIVPIAATRWSITFRTLSQRGRAAAA